MDRDRISILARHIILYAASQANQHEDTAEEAIRMIGQLASGDIEAELTNNLELKVYTHKGKEIYQSHPRAYQATVESVAH